MSLANALAAGLETMQCALDTDQQSALLSYISLLKKWNKVYNLTAVRDPAEMVHQHLLDAQVLLLSLMLPARKSPECSLLVL